MNKKTKTVYVCSSCGQDYSKWHGKCDNCGAWDTVTEFRQPAGKLRSSMVSSKSGKTVMTLADCQSGNVQRILSSFTDVDRVLGGGLVSGAFVLLGGDPGIGKSTLLLQLAGEWSKQKPVLYISGEESAEQVSMRGERLGVKNESVNILTETSTESVLAILNEQKPSVVVIDSIQTMFSESLESAPGSVSQIRESAAMLLRYAKENSTSIFLIGHVTKEGTIAGPRLLEHMVDTVLQFEGDANYNYRILRAVKNRFGPSGEIALFSMADNGLREVTNASEFFLQNREQPQIGTSVVPIIEGSRVLVVELQSLVNRSHFGLPQRVASGINPRKLSLLLAVLERHGGIVLGDHDIFFNIAGGLTVSEPGIDLGIMASILSSFRNKPLRRDTALIGEVGLGGEVRPVNNMSIRLKELSRMGFKQCIVTKPKAKAEWIGDYGLTLTYCEKIGDLQHLLF